MPFILPQETTFYLLEKSMKRYRKLAQEKIKETGYDITLNQLILLINLKERPQATQVELAKFIFKDFASVTRMVEILVKKRYLKRKENPIDRRKKDLILTPECLSMLDKLIPTIQDYRNIALKNFSKNEIKVINSFLNQLIDNCETYV